MKTGPKAPASLLRRPPAASPPAGARRPTAGSLPPARSIVRERAVVFVGGVGPRAVEPAAPVSPMRLPGQPLSSATGGRPDRSSALPAASSAAPPGNGSAGSTVGPGLAPGFHGAVVEFKRRLIETTLTELGGNRTRTARALGLQRTYLLRLMREFAVHVPAGPVPPRRSTEAPGTVPAASR